MTWTDARMHNARTEHIHQTEVVTTITRSPQANSTKIEFTPIIKRGYFLLPKMTPNI